MRILFTVLLLLGILTGCGAHTSLETVNDEMLEYVEPAACSIELALPEGAAEPVMESVSGGTLYSCDGFWVSTCTMPGGDLDRTFQEITGFGKGSLRYMETRQGNLKRYDCAWTAAGEVKQQVCRTVILDDGKNHYAVTASCDFDLAGVLKNDMQSVLDSVSLTDTD